MNATALPAATYPSPSTTRQRAAAVIAAWLAWRASKVKLEHAVETMACTTLILAWTVAYVVVCPAVNGGRHHAHRPAPAAASFVVLR